MIRSLIVDNGVLNDDSEVKLRRNIGQTSLKSARQDGKPLWLDIVDPTEEELGWIEALLNLHPEVVQNISRHDHRPTLLIFPTYLFITLFEPQFRGKRIVAHEIHCIVAENCFVTVRSGADDEVYAAYNRVATQNKDAWKRGVSYLLYLTMQYVIDAYYPLLDKLSLTLDKLEQNVLMDETLPTNLRQNIYQVKQQLITLRQMIAPQREVLSSAIGAKRLTDSEEDRDLFRHLYERLLRIYDVVDAQRDLSSNILDLVQNHESANLTNAVSRLTIISMIFLPLTFLAALLELNFITPESPTTLPISGAMALASLVVTMLMIGFGMAFVFHRRGWL